jgi:hypothetical protein
MWIPAGLAYIGAALWCAARVMRAEEPAVTPDEADAGYPGPAADADGSLEPMAQPIRVQRT